MKFFKGRNQVGALILYVLGILLIMFGSVFLIINNRIVWGIVLAVFAIIGIIFFIYSLPYKIENGTVKTSFRKIEIFTVEAMFLTNYSNTGSSPWQLPLFTHTKDNGLQVNAMYMYLLKNIEQCESDIQKYHSSFSTNDKLNKENILFKTAYTKDILDTLFTNGFKGKVYIFRQLYEDYLDELEEVFDHNDFQVSNLIKLEYYTNDGKIKPDFKPGGKGMYTTN